MVIITGNGRCGTSVIATFCSKIGFSNIGGDWIDPDSRGGAESTEPLTLLYKLQSNEDVSELVEIIQKFDVVKSPQFVNQGTLLLWSQIKKLFPDLKVLICSRNFSDVAKSFQKYKMHENGGTEIYSEKDVRYLTQRLEKYYNNTLQYLNELEIEYKIIEFPKFLFNFDVVAATLNELGLVIKDKTAARLIWNELVETDSYDSYNKQITLVSSLFKDSIPYLDILINSITKMEFVTECILAVTDQSIQENQFTVGQTEFNIVHLPNKASPYDIPGFIHGCGLNYALSLATKEYIMFCDHDIYFYLPVDKIYLSLMEKHSLDVIGISHFSPTSLFFHYFPTVINMLVKKDKLPGAEFLEEMRATYSESIFNLYTPPGQVFEDKIKAVMSLPFPNGHYDTGSLLYFWALKNNWRWLSFQTKDALNYNLSYCRGNITNVPKLKSMNFLYHESNKKQDQLIAIAESIDGEIPKLNLA